MKTINWFKIAMHKPVWLTSLLDGSKDSQTVDVVIHIGLPKTATTFLQHSILAISDQLNLIDRKTAPKVRRRLNSVLRGEKSKWPSTFIPWHNKDLLKVFSKDLLNVVSDENISIKTRYFWENCEIGPTEIATNINALSRKITGKDRSIRIILTIRRQDRWLASRYAESAKKWENASQSDFEDRISNTLRRNSTQPENWLNYAETVETLNKQFGRDNVLVLMLEELEKNPVLWIEQLGSFLKITDLGTNFLAADQRTRNVLSTGHSTWKLKGHISEIELSSTLSNQILSTYSATNRRLAEEFGVDGVRFGYY